MEQLEFKTQVQRLASVFGDKYYHAERVKILWDEIKHQDFRWFEKIITKFISDSNNPPAIIDFRTEISIEREKLHNLDKKKFADEARLFFGSSYTQGDAHNMIAYMIERIKNPNSILDQDWDNFVLMLKNVADESKFNKTQCRVCESTGLVFKTVDDYERVYECQCSWGQSRKANYPTYKTF